MEDIFVRHIKLPVTVRGMVVMDENGDYNIYLNESLSTPIKKQSLLHELQHIWDEDFFSDKDIREIERKEEYHMLLASLTKGGD